MYLYVSILLCCAKVRLFGCSWTVCCLGAICLRSSKGTTCNHEAASRPPGLGFWVGAMWVLAASNVSVFLFSHSCVSWNDVMWSAEWCFRCQDMLGSSWNDIVRLLGGLPVADEFPSPTSGDSCCSHQTLLQQLACFLISICHKEYSIIAICQ